MLTITEVTIKNMLLHEDTDLKIKEAVSLFLGLSEQGKTTIPAATRWALDEKWIEPLSLSVLAKQNHGLLIRNGQKKAEVSVKLADGAEYARSRTPKGSTGPKYAFDLNPEAFSCLFNSTYFYRMDQKARAAMLFELLGLNLTADEAFGKAQETLGRQRAEIFTASEWTRMKTAYAKTEFKGAQEVVIELRREFKRKLDEIPTEKPSHALTVEYEKHGKKISKDVDIEAQGLTVEVVREKIRELRDRRDGLLTQMGALKAEEKAEDAGWIRQRLQEKEEQLADIDKRLDSRKNAADELKALDEKTDKLRKEMEATRDDIRKMEFELDGIPAFENDKCPTCERKLTKAMSEAFKTRAFNLKEDLRSKRTIHDNQKLELTGISEKRASLILAQTDYMTLSGKRANIREEIERLTAKEKKAKVGGATDDIAALQHDIDDAAGALTGFEILKSKIEEYDHRLEAYQSGKKQIAELDAKIAACNALDTLFGPGKEGIRAEMTKAARSNVNKVLDKFTKLLGRGIQIDEELNPVFSDGVQEIALSTSAKRRAGIAMQAAIALISGFKFFVTDDSENLDTQLRRVLLRTMLALSKEFGLQVWILAALGQEELDRTRTGFAKAPIPGVQVFMIEKGTTREIIKEAA